MSTAPKDGTMILVCESPNGEQYNVLPAAYLAVIEGHYSWWGVHPRKEYLSMETVDPRFKHYFSAIALNPICWKPYPRPEDVKTLRRRKGQLLARKYKGK